MNAPLFRKEVYDRRAERLSGEIILAVPLAWQVISYLLLAGLVALAIFLSLVSYSRVETVGGAIVPDKGITAIVPTRNGVITNLGVQDGQFVRAGTVLASIRAEEDSAGESSATRIREAIAQQEAHIAGEMSANSASLSAQRQQLLEKRAGLSAEIMQIKSQISLQSALVSSAQRDLDRAKTIAINGFISGRDIQMREEAMLQRRQQFAQLQQSLASARADLAGTERSASLLTAQADREAASIAASSAAVEQQAATAEGARSYVLRAPVSGLVTAVTGRIGQAVSSQTQLLAILPAASKLEAQLSVPSSAIGFMEPGQEVHLSVDAFPYERFGTLPGEIAVVSAAAVQQASPKGGIAPVYLVTVRLRRTSIPAYGRDQPLLPGMSVTARVITRRQTLIQWLFDPLFAIRKR